MANDLRIIAVWKYDVFPHMLMGEVERFNADGNPVIKGYQGGAFRTRCFLSMTEAAALQKELSALEDERKKALLAFETQVLALKKKYNVHLG